MWKWIKKLFRSWSLKKQTITPDYDKMTKGDLRKLKEQGKIKSVYKPYN